MAHIFLFTYRIWGLEKCVFLFMNHVLFSQVCFDVLILPGSILSQLVSQFWALDLGAVKLLWDRGAWAFFAAPDQTAV